MDEYQGYFADCYVLTDQRNELFVERFLDHFVPKRKETADEYELPQYTDKPLVIFTVAQEIVKHLVENPAIKYSLYWANCEKSDLRGAELFFTDDSHIIMGIYCETKYPNTEIEDNIFKQMKEFCESDIGYITCEDIPPQNSKEFIEVVKKLKT